ncbi:hypothetical protein [Bordetella hinzii]|uniref:hypothetical protein n=1 Tax=Bordetella hinzii TaxID=103855 RepID=UPI000F6F1699|nr:hypothetical protein [Bordetella hinzii]VEH23206.1 Uncharacterised protein [Bordetella hinzii]VEH33526.1 Uncharacterised protein [Bordetella hinzii]
MPHTQPNREHFATPAEAPIVVRTVNEAGLVEISDFLDLRHRLGGEHFTRDMLRAWAADAEFQMGEGNPPTIEIPAHDSTTGATVTYTISDAGIDTVEVPA